ncbi:hypothetical protein [Streptococcus zalophi]|uniref:hypothetical protein n=1 Tax=Streptococcus zalophi TaxID=640031 RepID=UPI00215C09C6|nr:hypothetical protein [Streptococcus zalophi]MCR8968239.1 hypothetical protein [Streptococcus zalophi]
MIDERLKFKTMPAAVILNNFVENETRSNYELFLLEYLNQSDFFQTKSNHKPYHRPESESNSEWDALSDNYSIDFKLLASPSLLRGLRLKSKQISVSEVGIITYSAPRNINDDIRYSELHALIRPLKLNDIIAIRNQSENIKQYSYEYEISNVLKTVETQKNILLLFPKRFIFEETISFDEAVMIIGEALKNDFDELSRYREIKANRFEAYLLAEFNDHFLLYSFNPDGFELIESFDSKQLVTYRKLIDYADPFGGMMIGT